jgi:hypothetical protein
LNYDDVVALGQRLASALDEHDFLGRWMAAYLAEVLAKGEHEVGEARDVARREAFDVVLQLWQRRRDLPMARTPLHGFDYVFATLDRLSDNTPWGYFDLFKDSEAPASDRSAEINLLAVTCALDANAREVVRLTVAVAGAHAAEEDEEWTTVARGFLEDDHQRAIRWTRRLRSDPRERLNGHRDTVDDESLETEPTSIVTQRLIAAIDNLSETLRSAKRMVGDSAT